MDDESNDNTAKIVWQFADPSLTYIRHEKKKKVVAAHNTSLNSSRRELVRFICSVDLWKQEMLDSEVLLAKKVYKSRPFIR